ncbi:hypothetical protein BKA69DRAFT_205659 [Paraphysoderma sedebokerense]|nr:hypothetical protein BKA69DRAFT_205659 [Paraphysoderma sedebokerense]
MKLNSSKLPTTVLVLLLLSHFYIPFVQTQSCGQIRIRKEIRTLTVDERTALSRGLRRLYENGVIRRYNDMHNQMRDVAHGTPGFLSRHRVMVKMFEDELMSVSGGALTGLPYWDPTIEAGNPRGSVVLTPDYMGTANPGCIQDGPAAGWMMNDGRCVERGFRGGTWVSTTVVLASIAGLRSYTRLNTVLEGGFHSVVHNAIGGNMPDSTRSPWDPLFWMLHGGVDYYYAVWENNGNYGSYDGEKLLT